MVRFEYNLDDGRNQQIKVKLTIYKQVATKMSVMEILKCTHNGREILDFYQKKMKRFMKNNATCL